MSKAEEVKAIIKATVVVLDFDQAFAKKMEIECRKKEKERAQAEWKRLNREDEVRAKEMKLQMEKLRI